MDVWTARFRAAPSTHGSHTEKRPKTDAGRIGAMPDPTRIIQVPKTAFLRHGDGKQGHAAETPTGAQRAVGDYARPAQTSLCWAIPKLPVTLAARLFLFACWYWESDGDDRPIYASNATLAEWAGLNERTIRNVKKMLGSLGLLDFIYRSKGKGDPTGRQTDIFVVRWQKVFEAANAAYEARTRRRRVASQAGPSWGTRHASALSCATVEEGERASGPGDEKRASSPESTQEKGEGSSEVGERATANMIFSNKKKESLGKDKEASSEASEKSARRVTVRI
jgi:Helix-turn-helix domain